MAIRFGTSGDDVLVAQSSTDTLVGLDGNDIFDFSLVGTAIVIEEAGGGTDTIITPGDAVLQDFVENLTLTPGAAASVLTGNTLDNRIEGAGGADTLDGGAGKDTLVGGGGNDLYFIDNANDVVIEAVAGGTDEARATVSMILAANVENGTLMAGSIATTLTGNILDNMLVGNELANLVDGAAGNDTISGNDGNDTLRGGDGNDSISGDAGNDSIDGGNGNDTLFGMAGDDRLTGGAGNDLLTGGTGRDTLIGGTGNDTYVLAAGDGADVIIEAVAGGIDTVLVDASILSFTAATGIEAVIVSGGNDFTLIGNAAANTLVGGTGADHIEGLAGNDAIDGGAGADTMIGGLGNDQYTVDNAGDQVIELSGVGSGNDRVFSSLANYTLPANVERLMLVEQSAALVGVGNALDNVIDGNSAANRLEGGAGNDLLDGHAGIDTMVGGAGNDTFVVDVAGDSIVELANGGTDLVRVAADITYTMADNVETAQITAAQAHVIGNRGANTITGGAGADILDGGRGIDRLIGGAGDDTYYVDNAADTIVENPGGGIDTVYASTTYTLAANVDRLILVGAAGAINGIGSAGNDTITGNGSANTLDGRAGNDVLIGGAGNDTLIGGEGNDVLDGGTGVNAFDGGNGNDTYVVSGNADTIVDSGGHDLLLSNLFQADLSSYTTALPLGGFAVVAIEDLQLAEGALIRNGFGNALDNRIIGNSQANLLDGGAGNDFIDGAGGSDVMRGGLGNDTMRVSDAGDKVVENPNAGIDTVLVGLATYDLSIAPAGGENRSNIENLVYEGTADATLTGNALANKITGGIGNDLIDGKTGNDTMIGGAGNDTYVVDSLSDVVTEAAGGGNDKVIITANNTLPLSAVVLVDLTATTSTATRYALPNVENVTIQGTGLYNITGNAADNVLVGNGSSNTILGGAGNDSIDGGAGLGADSMAGGTGDDTYMVRRGDGAIGGQQPSDDIITELANGGHDLAIVNTIVAGDYLLPAFVEDLQGTLASGHVWSGNGLDNAIDIMAAGGGTINPGLGTHDSVTVRGLTSETLTVTDPDGTDFVALVLSGGTSTLHLEGGGVDDVRFNLLSGTSTETAFFAPSAAVLVTGAGSLGLNGVGVTNAYTLNDFTGTLTFGATAAGASDALALTLDNVQGALATTNTAVERFDLDSQGAVANTLGVGGVGHLPVVGLPGLSVTGETTLDLTGIGNTGFDVLLHGFTGARLGLAAQTVGSIQDWTLRTDGSATELAITAGTDANFLTVNTNGTGGESVLTLTGESTAGTVNLVGNQGLSLLGVSGGTVNSTMDGIGVVLRAVFDGATNFVVTSGQVDTNLTGSSGADTFVYGASLDSNDVVAGGGGTDSLTATFAAPTLMDAGAVVTVAPTIASVEAITFNVLGRYLIDATAMDASVVTITGGGVNPVFPIPPLALEVQNGRGEWNASAYNKGFTFSAAADANGVTVTGGSGVDNITGSAGNDVIDAKAGALSTVTGGDGNDIFRFTTAANGINVTNVTDFQSGVDHIELANETMALLGANGALDPSVFKVYSDFAALAAGPEALKYSSSVGQLFYDNHDPNVAHPHLFQIMTLNLNGGVATLAASDITVI